MKCPAEAGWNGFGMVMRSATQVRKSVTSTSLVSDDMAVMGWKDCPANAMRAMSMYGLWGATRWNSMRCETPTAHNAGDSILRLRMLAATVDAPTPQGHMFTKDWRLEQSSSTVCACSPRGVHVHTSTAREPS